MVIVIVIEEDDECDRWMIDGDDVMIDSEDDMIEVKVMWLVMNIVMWSVIEDDRWSMKMKMWWCDLMIDVMVIVWWLWCDCDECDVIGDVIVMIVNVIVIDRE